MHGLRETMPKAHMKKRPWNQGKTVGQRRPFSPREIQAIRYALEQENNARDLALLNTAIDTMLRASDLLALKVEDVTDHMGAVVEDVVLQQQKTKIGTVVTLSDKTRRALDYWMAVSLKMPSDYLFTGERRYSPLSRSQYARLVKTWATYARLDPRHYSTHSMRRTKSSVIYDKTRNLAACQKLLGHKSIGSTAAYLGVDQRQALDIAKKIDV
jgi:integrase